jgi:hypothetical protein
MHFGEPGQKPVMRCSVDTYEVDRREAHAFCSALITGLVRNLDGWLLSKQHFAAKSPPIGRLAFSDRRQSG